MKIEDSKKTVLIAGGAGFIGSHFVEHLIAEGYRVVNLDALTYAGNLGNLAAVADHRRYVFVHGNIGDRALVLQLLARYRPLAIFNMAAESHVDRSIENSADFIDTNVVGVHKLLGAALEHWRGLAGQEKAEFRYIQMSTDETFGSIAQGHFTEDSPYLPNSPYAASKASGDHLVRAFHVTYGLPALIARASNTYGPRQFPEKLIPHMIISTLRGHPLQVYGQGLNVRDWMFVSDLVRGLRSVLDHGTPGETYNFAAGNELPNIETVQRICAHLDKRMPGTSSYSTTIKYVTDRPGHDLRYAMMADKVHRLFGWAPDTSFEKGLPATIDWYLSNRDWWEEILERGYKIKRMGLGVA